MKPYKLLRYKPQTGKKHAATICTMNLRLARTPTKSSITPIIYIRNTPATSTNVEACSTGGFWFRKISNTKATIIPVSIAGMNNIPPKRGTASLWIFRSLGLSYKFFCSQNFITCGIRIAVKAQLTKKATIVYTTIRRFIFITYFINV